MSFVYFNVMVGAIKFDPFLEYRNFSWTTF